MQVPVHHRDMYGRTPLHNTARRTVCSPDDVRDFILRGAEVDAITDLEETPLHLAARAGHTEAMKVLLSAGANPYKKQHDGRSMFELVTSDTLKQLRQSLDSAILKQKRLKAPQSLLGGKGSTGLSNDRKLGRYEDFRVFMKKKFQQVQAQKGAHRRELVREQKIEEAQQQAREEQAAAAAASNMTLGGEELDEDLEAAMSGLDSDLDDLNWDQLESIADLLQEAVSKHQIQLDELDEGFDFLEGKLGRLESYEQPSRATLDLAHEIDEEQKAWDLEQSKRNSHLAAENANHIDGTAEGDHSENQQDGKKPGMDEFMYITQPVRCLRCGDAFTRKKNGPRRCRYHHGQLVAQSGSYQYTWSCCHGLPNASGCSFAPHLDPDEHALHP